MKPNVNRYITNLRNKVAKQNMRMGLGVSRQGFSTLLQEPPATTTRKAKAVTSCAKETMDLHVYNLKSVSMSEGWGGGGG